MTDQHERRTIRGIWRPIGIGVAVLLIAAIGFIAFAFFTRGEIRPSQRMHPDGIVFGAEVPADRLVTASFVTDLAVAPDGEIFYVEHLTGRIGRLTPSEAGSLIDTTVVQFDLPEAGRLFHLALHPEWPVQPVLYVTAHEGMGTQQRLAVFRVQVNAGVGDSPERLVGGLPTEDPARGPQADHYGSALAICESFLYLSIGDTDSPGPGGYRPGEVRFRAQQADRAEGKILRYRLDGIDLEPAGVLGDAPPVYALGLRNVFAMDCDPSTGWPIAVDNGTAGFDQIRLIEPGSNHEWPRSDERNEQTPPLFDSADAAIAPTGIVARRSGAQGTELLFTSFHLESVYALLVGADGELSGPVELRHAVEGTPLSLAGDAAGCVYLGTSDGIWLIREPGCDRQFATAPSEAGTDRFSGDPASVYTANCAPCHGLQREGGEAPRLRDDRLTEPDAFYIDTILEGRLAAGMPSWAAAGMSEAQARVILEFLRSDP